ncbi:MAG: cytochrome c3 family protein [Pseudomonadota bacterium]
MRRKFISWGTVARLCCLAILVFLGPAVGVSPCHAAGCLANGCHTALQEKKYVHEPAAGSDCESCHSAVSSNHPSGAKGDFRLVAEGSDLCFACHDQQGFDGQRKHGPSASGACTTCHDPHSADQPALMRTELQQLCLGCHQDFAKSMKDAPFLHSAITKQDCTACHLPHSSPSAGLLKGDSTDICFDCHKDIKKKYDTSLAKHKALYIRQRCGNCHSAHFSKYPALLLKQGQELCFGCHGESDANRPEGLRNIRKDIEGKKVVHGPVADGECIECHEPHGGSYAKVLNGPFPQAFYAPFQPDQYDFCFRCHDKELLTAQPVKDQTSFRNGSDNLHFRHVARKQKGRTCRACHSLHASDGQKLINPDGIAFGNWKIPIRFEANETGGGCVPGCHRALNYDRKDAVDYTKKEETEPKAEGLKDAKESNGKKKDIEPLDSDLEPLDTEPTNK